MVSIINSVLANTNTVLTLVASPSPSPSPSPTSVASGFLQALGGDIFNGGILSKIGLDTLLSLLKGLASNPYGMAGVLLGVSILLTFIWKFLSAKFKAWEEAQAQNNTNNGENGFIQDNTGTNTTNTNDDNNGRNNLDNTP
jgi:hypothetical protein